MGISALTGSHHKTRIRRPGWGLGRKPRWLRGLNVRVAEVDRLPIPYFEKLGKLWTAEEIDDFFEWPFHRAQQREFVLLMTASVRRSTAYPVQLNDIEVVMQETWLAREERIAGYDPDLGRPLRWVLRGMCYRLRDRVKSRGQKAAKVEELSPEREQTLASYDLSVPEQDLIRTMDGGRKSALLRGCIERLKPTYREVLLCDLEEMDQSEAAALLGINKALVRQRRHRARKALTRLLPEGLSPETSV